MSSWTTHLAPVDVTDDDSVACLEALVWPGEGDRLALLRAALGVALDAEPLAWTDPHGAWLQWLGSPETDP